MVLVVPHGAPVVAPQQVPHANLQIQVGGNNFFEAKIVEAKTSDAKHSDTSPTVKSPPVR